jgi:hypothetical protein
MRVFVRCIRLSPTRIGHKGCCPAWTGISRHGVVTEVHPKGEEGKHRFVTGKLIHLGKMEKQIKIETTEGERVFPLEKIEVKSSGIEEGSLVTVEVNEMGSVIDLHRAKSEQGTH